MPLHHPPYSEELWPLPWCGGLRLACQTADVVDREDGGRDEPRRPKDGTDADLDGYEHQIQVVATSFLWDREREYTLQRGLQYHIAISRCKPNS